MSAFSCNHVTRRTRARGWGSDGGYVQTLGWQGKRGELGFLWGAVYIADGVIGATGVAFHAGNNQGAKEIAAALHARGTYEAWQVAVAGVMQHPRVAIGYFAALAAPLLTLIDEADNFGLEYACVTSRGKTTAIRVPASVWGQPDDRQGVIRTWDASRTNVERTAAALASMPVILDDTKRAHDTKAVGQFVYDFMSGQGRGRATIEGLAPTGVWRSVLLSTGEAPLTSFSEDGGVRARVIEIASMPFERADADTGLFVVRLRNALLENYGHAGPRYIAWLQKSEVRIALQPLYRHWRDQWLFLAAGHPVASRMAGYFATLTVAGLASQALFALPATQEEVLAILRRIWDEVAPSMADADPPKRALQQVREWTSIHPTSFWGRHRHDPKGQVIPPNGGWAGQWDLVVNWTEVSFITIKLEEILRELGHDSEGVISAWAERGWLVKDHGRRTVKRNVAGDKVRCYVIRRSAIESETDDVPTLPCTSPVTGDLDFWE